MKSAALVSSVGIHAGLLAWIVYPYGMNDIPQQQVVDINVVKISSPAPEHPDSNRQAISRLAPPAPPQAMHVMKTAQPARQAATPLTTGPQAPRATRIVAAITEPVYNAAYLHNAPPAYPLDARRRGMQGRVLLDVKVTPAGSATDISIRQSSGHALLDTTALNAVKKWRFAPARQGDESIAGRVLVPVEFRLE